MRHGRFLKTSLTIFAIVALTLPHFTAAPLRATETTMTHIPHPFSHC
jgi:hypothetical protein